MPSTFHKPALAISLHRLIAEYIVVMTGSLLLLAFGVVWMLERLGGENVTATFSDTLYAVATMIGAFLACLSAWRFCRRPVLVASRRYYQAWLLVGLALFASGLGGMYNAIEDMLGQIVPVPSYADIGYMLCYPLMVAGLLLLPTRFRPPRLRLRLAVEASMITLSLVAFSWYFWLGSSLMGQWKQTMPLLALVVSVAYPVGDLLFLFAIVLLVWQRVMPLFYPALALYCAGLLATIWADSAYAYFLAQGSYQSGMLTIDIFWPLGSLLLGLAASTCYLSYAQQAWGQQRPGNHTLGTPSVPLAIGQRLLTWLQRQTDTLRKVTWYLPLIVIGILTFSAEWQWHDARSVVLLVFSVVAILLVAMRALLILQEQEIRVELQARQREEAEHLRLFSAQLTELLDRESIGERIVTLLLSELGLDGVLLVIQAGLSDENPLLLIWAATPTSCSTWQVHEGFQKWWETMVGTEGEFAWQKQTENTPPEVHAWYMDQRVLQTHVVALVFREQRVGSLVFCSCQSRGLEQETMRLAKGYAQQAASALEQSQMYEQAQQDYQRALALNEHKDHILATIAHELRTPLAAVQGYLELLLLRDASLTAEVRKDFLEKAYRSSKHLNQLIRTSLDTRQLEEGVEAQRIHVEEVNVRDLFQHVVEILQPQAMRQQRAIHLDVSPTLVIRADAARLRQVLLNLGVNALKYSPAGTPVTFTAQQEKESVIVSVIDKGNGIPPEEQAQLFQRFVRLERDRQGPVRGSGLGLYICRRLMEAMGGALWVESSGVVGAGSAFHCRLPGAGKREEDYV